MGKNNHPCNAPECPDYLSDIKSPFVKYKKGEFESEFNKQYIKIYFELVLFHKQNSLFKYSYYLIADMLLR